MLDRRFQRVSLYIMNATSADESIPDIGTQANELTKQYLHEWFDLIDRLLDVHRSNFVMREATPQEIEKHKSVLKLAIRNCHLINALTADPDFDQPDLVSRLQIRIRQLGYAYSLVDHSKLSEEEVEQLLQRVFPE